MSDGNGRLYRNLRISGSLIIAGLLVELLSLIRIHPLAFLGFMFIGGVLLIAGVGHFLYWVILHGSPSAGNPPV
jgi:hypothetical protein